MIFVLQVMLCWFMISYFTINQGFEPTDVSFVVIGYICCMLNHLYMQPRVLAALQRLNFIYLHPENFEGTTVPALICLMKLIIEVSIEML